MSQLSESRPPAPELADSRSQNGELTSGLLFFLALACGLTVANIYYNQPLLTELRNHFGVSIERIGHVPTLTQLGYACGMLFLTPLGDRFNRKTLIIGATVAVTIALGIAALSIRIWMLEFASFLLGLSAFGAQIIVPHVAHLAGDKRRGEAVGRVMTGLLLGILLARTASGFIGSIWGWRAVFICSAVVMALLTIAMVRLLPDSQPTFKGTYTELLKSVWRLVLDEPILRYSSLTGAFLFAGFSAIWATLIYLLGGAPFGMGPQAVGLFGLLGAAGAASVAVMGKTADRKGAVWTLKVSLVVAIVSYALLGFSALSMIGLVIGIFFMDAGIQSAHVSNQARYFQIRPEARSRMNTVYMFCYFVGGAAGSYFGTLMWTWFQWRGVCALSFALTTAALAATLISGRNSKLAP